MKERPDESKSADAVLTAFRAHVSPSLFAAGAAGPEELKSALARLRETLPGSRTGHDILDLGPTAFDDFGPVKLGTDEYFLLGDNRDMSADSRVGPVPVGLGIVRGAQIMRRVILPQGSTPR